MCYHGPLLYEAKCLKAEMRSKTPHYLIHYSGWNKSWDEWVSCPRVLKYNEENLKKQQELLATHGYSSFSLHQFILIYSCHFVKYKQNLIKNKSQYSKKCCK